MQESVENIPRHIGIIMDGNGRWAKKQGKPRIFGHKAGMDAIEKTAIYAQKRGVKVLTVYAFSTENWSRPSAEVKFIMSLPIDFYERFVPVLHRENIRIGMIGDRSGVPQKTLNAIGRAMADTRENTGMLLNFAMNYGGRAEILTAVKLLVTEMLDLQADALLPEKTLVSADRISEEMLSARLTTAGLPDPDLIIRTSGELRLSNFLTWQSAYSELYFTDTLWPDFDEKELDQAILSYQSRDRRYGGLKNSKKRPKNDSGVSDEPLEEGE